MTGVGPVEAAVELTAVLAALDLPATVPLPLRIPGIGEATLSTGANIVSARRLPRAS
ncbi:hypothetical protein [Billgrantia endophytica]|uniref:hypothetical protein n=1 Tax=Billgrantia endophytica TaxID=2033802 RepID=UPI00197A900E|nr:hypothetical protein [Halomonas endophytica]